MSADAWGGTVVRVAALAVLTLVILWLIFLVPQVPRADRAWVPEHRRLARAEFHGDSLVTIRDLRDFAYRSETEFTEAYADRTYDLASIESAWFILTPFSSRWRGPAHAFVSFGFGDGQYVAISVEARREAGETYGVVAGMLRRYELAYIVGTERDLIGRRALYDGDDVYLYPIETSRERVRQLFVEMLRRGNALQERPEFYNTLTSNCTSNLVDHVNRMIPGRIPSSLKTLLPGYSDELALSLGLIENGGSVEEVRARFRINDRARDARPGDDFSAVIRGLASPLSATPSSPAILPDSSPHQVRTP